MSAMLTPLVGVAALAEEYHSRPALLHRYERRETPITVELPVVTMQDLVDTGGVVADEVHDEVTVEQCTLCGGPAHRGLCEGRR